jgi:hypothetical protein
LQVLTGERMRGKRRAAAARDGHALSKRCGSAASVWGTSASIGAQGRVGVHVTGPAAVRESILRAGGSAR